jgi:hypothetical protein
MPDHLQSRTDDMHPEASKKSGLRPSSILIVLGLISTIALILWLT